MLGCLTYSWLHAENLSKTECGPARGRLSTLKSYRSLTACCSHGLRAPRNQFKISCYVSNQYVLHLKISYLAHIGEFEEMGPRKMKTCSKLSDENGSYAFFGFMPK